MKMTIQPGRYIEADSPLHRLDPRGKLVAMILYLFIIILTSSLYLLLAVAAVSVTVILLTRIPFRAYARSLRPLRYLILFIFLFPIIFHDDTLISGVIQGTLTAGRMVLFVLFTAILTFTTRQTRLTQALEWLLKPFRRLGVSPEKWSLMMNLALRFIPTIVEEAQIVLKAQASRGVDFAEQSWRKKASSLLTLLVPVTTNTFRRAQELTESMEARGFVPGMPRSNFYELVWSRRDTWFVLGFVFFLCLMIVWRFYFSMIFGI